MVERKKKNILVKKKCKAPTKNNSELTLKCGKRRDGNMKGTSYKHTSNYNMESKNCCIHRTLYSVPVCVRVCVRVCVPYEVNYLSFA